MTRARRGPPSARVKCTRCGLPATVVNAAGECVVCMADRDRAQPVAPPAQPVAPPALAVDLAAPAVAVAPAIAVRRVARPSDGIGRAACDAEGVLFVCDPIPSEPGAVVACYRRTTHNPHWETVLCGGVHVEVIAQATPNWRDVRCYRVDAQAERPDAARSSARSGADYRTVEQALRAAVGVIQAFEVFVRAADPAPWTPLDAGEGAGVQCGACHRTVRRYFRHPNQGLRCMKCAPAEATT